ncbi:MAG TPA: RHS repeat-associated core domain-containing protein [Phycisphaerae bacterium]|nr:RHS repeat-associated core domain-containing protein [Phycisphaerae bacterium]
MRTRTVWYVYYETGHVSNIIVKDEGEGDDYDWYRGLSFTYWGLGHSLVGLALWEKWPEECGWNPGNDPPPEGYEKLALREFRYHPNPRGRFMARDLDPNDQVWEWSTVGAEHWTDYDIPMPNGDFDVTLDPNDAPVATEQMRYLEGFGLQGNPVVSEQMRYLEGFDLPAQQTVSTGATQYLHGDLIRSTMLTTGQGGTAVSAVSYTAFGEPIGTAPDTRYQYGGGWGYETAGFGDDPGLLVLEGAPATAPITLQHVGFRWYDPSIGRFIQRDPIGIFGGLNVYLYVHANPNTCVDPLGLHDDPFDDLDDWIGQYKREHNLVITTVQRGARQIGDVGGAHGLLGGTGGRNSWLDNPATVRTGSRVGAMVGFGILACVAPPLAAGLMGVGAAGWGGFRWAGGSTGSQAADDILDSGATGIGVGLGGRFTGGRLRELWEKLRGVVVY